MRVRVAAIAAVIGGLAFALLAPGPALATMRAVTATQTTATVTGDFHGDRWTSPVALNPADVANGTGNGLRVVLWLFDAATNSYEWQPPSSGWTRDTNGVWSLSGIAPGTYRIQFVPGDIGMAQAYWRTQAGGGDSGLARYLATAADVTLAPGQTFALGSVSLPSEGGVDESRLSGVDRFATAVAISRALFPGSPSQTDHPAKSPNVVYLVNGLNYPDALSAGPAAAEAGGLILLTAPTSLPPSVAAELARLAPSSLVVAGGPDSVSEAVMASAAAATGLPSTAVRRISGPDRYSTADVIIRDAFLASGRTGADTVFLATGRNYPDALAAGPAAADLHAPVLLVDGAQPIVTDSVLRLLGDLGVKQILIAGSEAAVSAGIEAQLTARFPQTVLGPGVQRLGGADRFRTAGAINAWTFRNSDLTFLATGYNFPDALAGVPLAGRLGAGIALTPPDCFGGDAFITLSNTQSNGVVLLGGESTLSTSVATLSDCPDRGFSVSFAFMPLGSQVPLSEMASVTGTMPARPRVT